MANIPLGPSTGGIFPRLDSIFSLENFVVSSYGSQLATLVSSVFNQYPIAGNSAIVISNLLPATAQYSQVQQPYLNELINESVNTVTSMANLSVPLNPLNLSTAIGLLDFQMIGTADSIQKPLVSSTVASGGTNIGNAVINTSITNQYGDQLDMIFAEPVTLTVTQAATNGGTQWAEGTQFVGQPLLPPNAYNWPGGSGATGRLQITDAASNGLLKDGSFESWTGATPNFWTIGTGAATVNKSTTQVVRGTYSFQITSDGSTLTQVYQNIVNPNIDTVYGFNVWCEMSSLDASGQIRFRLTDSSGNVIINDHGTNQQLVVGMNGGSGIGTSFTQIQTFFQTPRSLPTDGVVRFEFALTTAPSAAKIIYLDLLGFVAANQLYPGGIFAAGFSKSVPSAVGDYYTLTQTNNLGVHSNVRELDRWFNMRQLGLYLPTSLTPTIPDNIT